MKRSDFNRLLHLSQLMKRNTSELNCLLQQKKNENHGWILKLIKNISYKYKDCRLLALKLDESGKIIQVPDEFLKRAGYSREEVIGMSFHELHCPEKQVFYRKLFKFVIDTNAKIGWCVRKNNTKRGDPLYFAAKLEVDKRSEKITVKHSLFPLNEAA